MLQPGFDVFHLRIQWSTRGGWQLLSPRRRKERIVAPPINPDLTRFVDRSDQEPNVDREQLHLKELDPDVTGNDNAFIENPSQHIGKIRDKGVVIAGDIRIKLLE